MTLLAEQAGITKQTVGFLVDQLERAGYVERVFPTAATAARGWSESRNEVRGRFQWRRV